jgi:hypothetical protein
VIFGTRSGSSERTPLLSGTETRTFGGAEEYPDHPLLHAMEPTPFALVTARQEEPIRPDLGILDGNVPAGPVLPDPEPRHVGEARTVSGLWVKAMIRVSIQS